MLLVQGLDRGSPREADAIQGQTGSISRERCLWVKQGTCTRGRMQALQRDRQQPVGAGVFIFTGAGAGAGQEVEADGAVKSTRVHFLVLQGMGKCMSSTLSTLLSVSRWLMAISFKTQRLFMYPKSLSQFHW